MTNPKIKPSRAFGWFFGVLAISGIPISGGTAFAQSHTQPPPQSSSPTVVEYCVRCASPQATSVCSVTVTSGLVSVSEWQAFCASQVGFDGGYGQCSATTGVQACQADRVFSYRSTPGQGIVADSASGEPGAREGGFFEGAADTVRRAAQTLGDGVSVVGQSVRDGAEVVGETAGEVGRGVARGARRVGDSVTRGIGCVFTLWKNC